MFEKDLKNKIIDLIIKDKQLLDLAEATENRGIDFIDIEVREEEDSEALTYNFDVYKKYGLNKQFNKIYKIDTIDYYIDHNKRLTIYSATFTDNQEEEELKRLMKNSDMDIDYNENLKEIEKDNKKRIRNIEIEINDLIEEIEEDFIKTIERIKNLINDLIEEHFDNEEDMSFKDKINDFINDYKIKRTKNFTKSMIKNSIKLRSGEINLKIKKLLSFNNKAWSQLFQDYKEAKLLKEEKLQIDKLKRELDNILEDVIDYSFLEVANENYNMNIEMKKKYGSKIDEYDIEVDKRQLLLKVYEELTLLFRKFGLNKSDFKVV